jgi:hypothetical protein
MAGGDAGDAIGAVEVCAQTGTAIGRAAAMAAPAKRCLMLVSSLKVQDLT